MSYNLNAGYGAAQISGLPFTTGKVFLVADSSNANFNYLDKLVTPDPDGVARRYSTIANALDACTADRLDTILVAPGHAETLTAALAVDVDGVRIIGLGQGALKPTLTGNGTIDAVNITADDVVFENFHFAAPETDAQTSFINVTGTGVTIKDISGIGSQTAKNVVDCITVTATADDLVIDGVTFWNSVVAVNSFLSLEGAASRVTVKNFFAFGDVATAGIIDGAKIDYLVLENVDVAVVGTSKPAATLDSNPEGFAKKCNFAGTSTTLATNAALGNLMRLFDVKVLEETDGSAQGALIPAVDAD